MMGVADSKPARPGNYAVQARTFDLTRGASPTVIKAISAYAGTSGDGRSLLDIAGGTGNYARAFVARGFRVTVLDAQLEMLRGAARKLGPGTCVAGDAQALPFGDACFDCQVMVNAIHLFDDPGAAVAEARRVLRVGPLCATAFTRENLQSLFVYEYFGLAEPITARPPAEEVADLLRSSGFSHVRHHVYSYTDLVDGSLNALHTNAARLADPRYLSNTSFWHRLDEEARRRGVEALARDLRDGILERRVRHSVSEAARAGHGTVFAAWP